LKRIVLILVVLACAGLAAWYWLRSNEGTSSSSAPAPVPVAAAQVQQQNVPDYIRTIGTVQSIDSVSVIPRVNGQITQIFFKAGDEVKKDQPLFEIDPRPYQAALDQAQAQLAHDQAALKEDQVDLARYQELVKTKAIPEQQEQDQFYLVEQAKATVQVDQANVETAKLNLEYCHIVSPVDGRTGVLMVDLGNYVTSGSTTPLISITQMKPIYVTFTISQTMLSEVKENQTKGALNVLARSQAGKSLGTGKLTIINNQVAAATGTVSLQATFPNEDEALWPGGFVVALLEVFVRENAITVPSEAVMEGPNGAFVYVIKPDDTAQHVDVNVVTRQNNIAVIDKGLSAGEMVVTDGQYRLADNIKVRIENSPPPAETAAK
jgi:membrane fusion protein, multidrug efflux system